ETGQPFHPEPSEIDEKSENVAIESSDRSLTREREARRGPGLPESMGWVFLFFLLQMAGMAVVMALVMAFTLSGMDELESFDFTEWYTGLSSNLRLTVVTAPALFCYFVLIPLGLWRMAPRRLRKLDFRIPTLGQLLLLVSLVVPMMVIADSMMRGGES